MYFLDDLLEESFMNDFETPENDVELESIMSEMDELPVIECEGDDPFSEFLRVTCESTVNFNNIRNAIAMDELHYLRENGEEMVMEAETEKGKGRIAKIFAAIQAAIDKAWQRITGIVKGVLEKFQTWADADRTYMKNHEAAIKKLTGNETIKIKAYNFDNTAINGKELYAKVEGFTSVKGVGAVAGNITKAAIDEYNKNKKSIVNDIYKHISGKECASSKEFSKAIFDYFRKGGEKVEFTRPLDINTLTWGISSTKATKEVTKKAYDGAKKFLANLKKNAKSVETKLKTSDKAASKEQSAIMSAYINIYTRLINTMTTINTLVMQEHIRAIAQRNRMYKAMLTAAINASGKADDKGKDKDKEGPKNESTSFLDNLELA